MKKHIIAIFCLFSFFTNTAQDLQILKSGENVLNKTTLKSLKINKDIGSLVTNTVDSEFVHTATTFAKPEGVYNLSVKIQMLAKKVEAQQPMLISFKARSLQASLETNESKVSWLFRQTESSAPKDVVSKSVSISQNWQTYYIPFNTIFASDLQETTLAMQFGYSPQKFEIKDISVLLFPKTVKVSQLPSTKITYSGMEANAAWRVEAEKRIEQIRKGDFELIFNLNGKPLATKDVEIKQIGHHFRFGAAVSADDIVGNETYFNKVKSLFNVIVFENDLKMKHWRKVDKRKTTLDAIAKLNENNIKVKGHALLWPGYQYLPKSIEDAGNDTKKIENQLNEHYKSVLEASKGKISHWDVLNEAYSNKELTNVFKSNEILFESFRKAYDLDPTAKRYINEFGILSGGGTNTIKQDWYFNFVKEIDNKTSGLIDGLGMQSHIGTDLTPPTKVVEVLNRFGSLNKEIAISEFTLDILDDEELRGKYIRDYMIAAFSSKNVAEFLTWGFYAPTHPKAALVDQNYNLTKMGTSFYDLVFNKWMTRTTKSTDASGSLKERGFYGTYEFSVNSDGKTYKGTFQVEPDSKNKLKINLK